MFHVCCIIYSLIIILAMLNLAFKSQDHILIFNKNSSALWDANKMSFFSDCELVQPAIKDNTKYHSVHFHLIFQNGLFLH